jgi:membrane protease YdiL (CAAX protease family)
MDLPPSDNPVSVPPPPTGTEKIESAIASLFVGARGIRAGWRWIIFLTITFVGAGFLFVVAVAIGALHLKKGQTAGSSFTASSVLLQEAVLIISMFFAALIMSKIEKRPMGEYGLPWGQAFGRRFWQGVAWGFVAITLTMLLISAFHGFTFGTVALSGSALAKYAVIWAAAFLLTGFSEEFLFRGYSQFTLADGMGFWPAAVFLSLLFGGSHLSNPGEAWPGAISAGLIAFFFCFTLRRTGSIWFAVGLHAAWDYGETFVYGVPDSGFVAPGHLLNSSFHGPRWLTGGSVGPEASVLCLLIIALMFLVFHLVYPPQAARTD